MWRDLFIINSWLHQSPDFFWVTDHVQCQHSISSTVHICWNTCKRATLTANCSVCADSQNECNESCLTGLDLVVSNKSGSQHVSMNVTLLRVGTKHDLCLLAVIKWFKKCKHSHLDKRFENIQWLRQQFLLHIFLNFFYLFCFGTVSRFNFLFGVNYQLQISVQAFCLVFRYRHVALILFAPFLDLNHILKS